MTESRLEIERERLLRGEYELDEVPQAVYDDPQKPVFAYHRLNKIEQLYTPLLDRNRSKDDRPCWPNDSPFAVCLTHDVDHVTAYSPRQTVRGLFRMARHRDDLEFTQFAKSFVRNSGKLLRDSLKAASTEPDPYHCYERWLEMESEVGARSTFFFMPHEIRSPHFTDNDYRFDDSIVFDGTKQEVSDMISEIHSRGWEIGIHPTWKAATDETELRRQKKQIESVIGTKVVSARQHYLHYDLKETPAIQSSTGLKYDSSLGFNANVGFRFGTARPWQLYDWVNESRSNILEIPLIAQDVSLFRTNKGLGLDSETAVEYLKLLASKVKDVGGVLTLSWHPSYIINKEWRTAYERILKYLKQEGAWFATIRQLGDWWTDQEIGQLP